MFSEPGCLRLPKPLARTGNEALGSGEVVIQFRDGFAVVPPDRTAITHSIAAADVDGDGDLDVLLGNSVDPSRVLLNAGDGTFPTSKKLPSGSSNTYSIAAADVDGDGDLDVLLGNHGGPSQVLLNAGDGTFPMSIELPGGSASTYSIAVADVDGDGDLDVLLGNDGSSSRLLPSIRCSQPGIARSRFGNGCIRCPSPSSRRDDHFDICYECEEHTELNVRGECSPCKPGFDRSVGAAECTSCPRGKRQGDVGTFCVDCSPGTYAPYDGLFGPTCLPCGQGNFCPPGASEPLPCNEGSSSSAIDLARDDQCPHAPPPTTPPVGAAASLVAAASNLITGQVVSVLLSMVAFLVALSLAVACSRRQLWNKRVCSRGNEGVSLTAAQVRERLSSSGGDRVSSWGGRPASGAPSVHSDESTHLEVLDFSTLTIGRPIGKGGFATVWFARWQGNDLALKVLDVGVEHVRDKEDAMLQEVAILRRLRHPCICALFGHTRVDGRPALVLEYMAGGSLAAYLFNPKSASCNVDPSSEAVHSAVSSLNAAWRRFMRASKSPFALDAAPAPVAPQASLKEPPPRQHLDDVKICIAMQLASGLCFLHSHGILHRDVKTDNALLDATHTVCKLADFGLASLRLPNHTRCSRGDSGHLSVGGTLRYLAPERIDSALESVAGGDGRGGSSSSLSLGRTLVNFEDRIDVYAFALLLWELSHGCRAFAGMTGEAAALSAVWGNRPQFSRPSTSDRIQTLTAECWAQRPEDRPSMSTVLERLEVCMQALSATQSVALTVSSLQSSPPSKCVNDNITEVEDLNMDFEPRVPCVEPVETQTDE